jgi:hypothetical protein
VLAPTHTYARRTQPSFFVSVRRVTEQPTASLGTQRHELGGLRYRASQPHSIHNNNDFDLILSIDCDAQCTCRHSRQRALSSSAARAHRKVSEDVSGATEAKAVGRRPWGEEALPLPFLLLSRRGQCRSREGGSNTGEKKNKKTRKPLLHTNMMLTSHSVRPGQNSLSLALALALAWPSSISQPASQPATCKHWGLCYSSCLFFHLKAGNRIGIQCR